MPDVALTVAGARYGGWKSIRITRGIEQVAGTFELGVSERWPDMGVQRKIAPGDRCAVAVDGETVITGHVDDVSLSYDDASHQVGVSGRDATGDLVDCAAIHKSGKWAGRTMPQIAADLCAPFGISVRAETDTGAALPSWQIQEGESAFECLDRLARDRGVLLVSDGLGALVITRAGTTRIGTALVRGENILAASGTLSLRERFATYIVKGEQAGTDDTYGEQLRQKAVASDSTITRYRPLIVIADDQATGASMKRRAEWERNVRAGRSIDISVTVQGWAHAGGLWQSNRIVHVTDEWLRLDDDLLVKQVVFVLDEQGTRCELALTMPQAFDLIPLPAKAATAKEDNWWNLGN